MPKSRNSNFNCCYQGKSLIHIGSMSELAIKRQIDFPDGREFRSTGPHVRNPAACGSCRTTDVTHSRRVGHELSFHSWMSAGELVEGAC
jgi:hypothetical protein